MTTLPQTLITELKKLDDAQIFKLLGEIIEPSQGGPFDISERLEDCLLQMVASYHAAYDDFHADSTNDGWTETSDQIYDDLRADEAGVYAK